MTPALALLVPILVAHWVGDFILQTDEQAKTKSKCNQALFAHVISYTSTLLLAGALISFVNPIATGFTWLLWGLLNGVLHLGVDYVTSRVNASLLAEKRTHDFFVGVGGDQLLHTFMLILTLDMMVLR